MTQQTRDFVLPFQLEAPALRGRITRLSPAINEILSRHDYPDSISRLLAETATLTVLLAGMLKYQGIFTLQAKGEGAVHLLVADIDSAGNLRAYAHFDDNKLLSLPEDAPARDLLSSGHLAFTVDQGAGRDRYQGVVELEGNTMADFAQAYFRHSEQVETAFKIEISQSEENGWTAGGIMLQRLPKEEGGERSRGASPEETHEENWRRALMLMTTATNQEMTDTELPAESLLYRLFHEEGVRVYTPTEVLDKCRCSRSRVANMLATLSSEEREEIAEEGEAEVQCEFCSRTYVFTPEEVEKCAADKEIGEHWPTAEDTRH